MDDLADGTLLHALTSNLPPDIASRIPLSHFVSYAVYQKSLRISMPPQALLCCHIFAHGLMANVLAMEKRSNTIFSAFSSEISTQKSMSPVCEDGHVELRHNHLLKGNQLRACLVELKILRSLGADFPLGYIFRLRYSRSSSLSSPLIDHRSWRSASSAF
jgi:hypothetical protein